jgi:hypothetical protein
MSENVKQLVNLAGDDRMHFSERVCISFCSQIIWYIPCKTTKRNNLQEIDSKHNRRTWKNARESARFLHRQNTLSDVGTGCLSGDRATNVPIYVQYCIMDNQS